MLKTIYQPWASILNCFYHLPWIWGLGAEEIPFLNSSATWVQGKV